MSIQPSTAAAACDPTGPGRNPHCSRLIRLGGLALKNRLVLSPMTRSRALEGNVPNPLAATYYAQRASAGLLITEAPRSARKASATSARPACIRPSRSRAGGRSPTPSIAAAA